MPSPSPSAPGARRSVLVALALALALPALTSAYACACTVERRYELDDDDDDFGDDDDEFGDDDDDDFGGEGEGELPPIVGAITCDEACAQVNNSEGAAAQCYACRCKAAFDDWLPSREQLQCGAGVDVEVYETVDADTSVPVGADEYPSECNNPSLFQFDCGRNARFGSIDNGDVTVRFLCRRMNSGGPPADTYDLVGVIGHNNRTGATCVWDAQLPLGDDDVPAFDITGADSGAREQFASTFYRTYGFECVSCHDSDPFIYTPYLKSVGWETKAYATGPYGFVQLDGSIASTNMQHLVGPPVVEQCTQCHRITNGLTCGVFVRDALGLDQPNGPMPLPHDFDPNSAFAHAVWMPDDVGERFGTDRAAWEAELGAARDKIVECCDDAFGGGGGAADCEWADIPAF